MVEHLDFNPRREGSTPSTAPKIRCYCGIHLVDAEGYIIKTRPT